MSERAKGWLALALAVLIWSTPALFQFYLIQEMDTWTQNFYRYLIGSLIILPLAWRGFLRRRSQITKRDLVHCLIPAIPNAVHQITQTLAVLYLMPGLYAVLGRLSVVFTAILAAVVFHDERWIVTNRKFQLGIFLGILGAVGVVMGKPNTDTTIHLSVGGLVLAFLALFSWALYSVLVKKYTANLGASAGFGMIGGFTTLLLFPLMLWLGEPLAPLRLGWQFNTILILSAVLCIGLGHILFYQAIRHLGAAYSQGMLLLCPLGSAALSYWLFGERFSWEQGMAGSVLLLGAWLSIRAKPKLGPTEPPD